MLLAKGGFCPLGEDKVPPHRVDRNKYQIQIPLPPKIDPTVTMMTVEEKPDVTYSDIGGCKEQIEKMREVVELPMLHPEKFVQLGIDPPKGVLCYGPPGTLLGCPQLCCSLCMPKFSAAGCRPFTRINEDCNRLLLTWLEA